MARTPSTMLSLGTSAPQFHLPDTVSGKTISLNNFADCRGLSVNIVLLLFMSNQN